MGAQAHTKTTKSGSEYHDRIFIRLVTDIHGLRSIEPFVSTIGPNLTSLELRNVNQTMFLSLVSQAEVFSTYHSLQSLKVDVREGVWDWNGGGSPQEGASADYVFPRLGFPSIKRFEVIVSDLTLSNPRTSVLELVDCTLLTELSLDVRHWCALVSQYLCM